jgi:uroporphyrinogen decarboxylase
MTEIDRHCIFNILHVCDYHSGYDDLTPFLDYPGHVVNCSQEVGGSPMSSKELAQLFNRPFMGGLERKGVIVEGSEAEIVAATTAVLQDTPDRFILGADCTLPGDVNWDNIRTAIATTHTYKQG